MSITTMTASEFNQDTGRAKRAAEHGPVYVTDRGKRTHVLLASEEYSRITGNSRRLADILSHPASADIEFDPPRMHLVCNPADFC